MNNGHLTHSNSVVFAYSQAQLLRKFVAPILSDERITFLGIRLYAPIDTCEPEHYLGVSTNNDYIIYLYDRGCLELEFDINGTRAILTSTITYTDDQPKGYPSLAVELLAEPPDIREHELYRNTNLVALPIINMSNSQYSELVAQLDLKPSTPC